jgi:D-amino-acid dehydrogenase
VSTQHDIVIIGAGIIGLTIADYLQRGGRQVTLIDRKGIANEASFGNAGALAFADILPLASSGMIRKAPKWLFDPLGPLSIRPSYLPTILPWLVRFWRASWAGQYQSSTIAQQSLMTLAESELDIACQTPVIADRVRHDGSLQLYENLGALDASLPTWAFKQQYGVEVKHLRGDEINEYQPGLSKKIVAATFIPGWKSVDDPHQIATLYWDRVQGRGGALMDKEVRDINPCSDGAELTFLDGSKQTAATVIVAAGAWSHHLARQLGDKIPLETERGYNTTLPTGAFDLKRQLTFGDHGFVITPLSTGIRIGGAVEFAGLEAEPNYKRSKIMLEKAKRFLPDLNTSGGTQWMGFRPSLPDSLPVISRTKNANRVFYAFGHGHLGLTQALATARLMSELVLNKPTAIDITPFRADRF